MLVSYIIPINHPLGALPTKKIVEEMIHCIVANALIYKIQKVKFRYKAIKPDILGFSMDFDLTLDPSIIVNPSINLKIVNDIFIPNELMAIYDAFIT